MSSLLMGLIFSTLSLKLKLSKSFNGKFFSLSCMTFIGNPKNIRIIFANFLITHKLLDFEIGVKI